MPYVVTENCIKCKYMDCVEVCPVDCFHEGESMLVIDPLVCIDCGVCVPECPAKAIKPDVDETTAPWGHFNSKYASIWPNISYKTPPNPDAEEWNGVSGKLETAFGTNDPWTA
ncbi:ferredoxin family protein [Pusillimonas sp. MFBS29]|uniref:ferredoxin FdxA n=1 Tax=Pusillimonas sp. MFBS29 TaxID=2886690 RepID=UPI001D119C08|nr:ferredoxin FdxA [Pusillimonas sp. MFBS29]MCC2595887.1 ferredoxin family protein [Pusillimonas sp. MFBS29]